MQHIITADALDVTEFYAIENHLYLTIERPGTAPLLARVDISRSDAPRRDGETSYQGLYVYGPQGFPAGPARTWELDGAAEYKLLSMADECDPSEADRTADYERYCDYLAEQP